MDGFRRMLLVDHQHSADHIPVSTLHCLQKNVSRRETRLSLVDSTMPTKQGYAVRTIQILPNGNGCHSPQSNETVLFAEMLEVKVKSAYKTRENCQISKWLAFDCLWAS